MVADIIIFDPVAKLPVPQMQNRAIALKKRLYSADPGQIKTVRGLFPDIFLNCPRTHFRAIDIASRIDGDALRGARKRAVLVGVRIGDEGGHEAVLDAADPNTSFPTGVGPCIGFGVGRIQDVILVDI